MIDKKKLLLVLIFLLAACLRLYKLDWGDSYFFHPDERNIANLALLIKPVLSFDFFTKGTFAYGSLISYFAFWANFVKNAFLTNIFTKNDFSFVVLFLRLLSAISSTAGVYLVYLIGSRFFKERVAILAAIITAFAPGLIQSAHFGTFESSLSLLYLLSLFFNLKFFDTKKTKHFFLSILILAVATAIKLNSILMLFIPILMYLILGDKKSKFLKRIGIVIVGVGFFLLLTLFLSPYYLTEIFRGMLTYERGVVSGTIDVFYTRSFFGKIPIVFQFDKIFLYITNLLATVTFLILVPVFLGDSIRVFWQKLKTIRIKIPISFLKLWLVFVYWMVLFLPNAFLFSKWTRYMVPSLPFMFLLISIFVDKYLGKLKHQVVLALSIFCILWGLAFMSIYFRPDVRLTASSWILDNVQSGSAILSETANVVDVPILVRKNVDKNYQIMQFDFYHLDTNPQLLPKLVDELNKADYIFVPSCRLFAGMGSNSEKYPLLNRYYQLLFNGNLGFEKVKEFSSYPSLFGVNINDERAEETWSVFDHPVIRVYKKSRQLEQFNYQRLLNNEI